MKRLLALALGVCCFSPWLRAGPNEAAILAAMKLSDAPNYAWTATVTDDARTYDIIGRTSKAGYTAARMPLINSVRRRTGRSTTEIDANYLFRGNVACVIETEEGWKRPDELKDSDINERNAAQAVGSTGHAPLVGGPPSGLRGPSSRKSRGTRGDRGEQNYSNIQLGLSLPHEELAVIVSSHDNLAVEGEVATGTLTDLGAQLLLVRDGQAAITPVRAAGTFKLWLHDGVVVKYQVRLEGILSVEANGLRREILVRQTTDTALRDVGTTKVNVPDQARLKLAGEL